MTKRRNNGEGALYRERYRGGWRWVGEVWLDGVRRRVTAKTKVEASAKLATLIREHEEQQPRTDGSATVGQLLAKWFERHVLGGDLSESSIDGYRWTRSVIEREIGHVRLNRLHVDTIEMMMDRLADEGLSRRSCKAVRSTLAQALDFGIRRNWTTTNQARIAYLPSAAKRPEKRRSLTLAEFRRMWATCGDEPTFGPLFKFQMMTATRPGEAAGTLWSDLDLDADVPVVSVRHAVKPVRGRPVFSDVLKSDSSYRTIPLTAAAVELLKAQRKEVAARKLAAAEWGELDLVFPSEVGTPLDGANVRRAMTRICESADVPRIVPHELRHTALSVLADSGAPLEVLSDFAGHSETKVTDAVYVHRLRPHVPIDVSVLDRLVTG